jgi:hypothetical protein
MRFKCNNSLFKDSIKTSLASLANGKGKRVTKGKLSVRRLETRSGESAKAIREQSKISGSDIF